MRLLPFVWQNGRPAKLIAVIMAAFAITASPARSPAQEVRLSNVTDGISLKSKIRPLELTLTSIRPAVVTKIPQGVTAPLYATLHLGPREHPGEFTLLLDAEDQKPSRLWVDANGDGDLTNDPPAEWKLSTYKGRENDRMLLSKGGATLRVKYGAVVRPMHVVLSRFDNSEPARTASFLPIYCTADYGRSGTVSLDGRSYRFWIEDALTHGDFRGNGIVGQPGIFILIDVNGNGRIDPRGEIYDAAAPFNIGGTTYEIKVLDGAGTRIQFTKSSRTVAEILPPPDLSPGKSAPSFDAVDLAGGAIHFPSDYRARPVLLYFWASWCGDCARERPNLLRAYQMFHPKGLDVLGISLDQENQADQLKEFLKTHAMDWRQVYDGKKWQAEIAQLYYIHEIPSAVLVDGSTGKILASGPDLLADRLQLTLERALSGFDHQTAVGTRN